MIKFDFTKIRNVFLMIALFISTVQGAVEMQNFSNDPLIKLIKKDLDADVNFWKMLNKFAALKKIADMDTSFFADYPHMTKKLPDYLVAYLEREANNPANLSSNDIESAFRNAVALIHFIETGNLVFLRLATINNDNYVRIRGRITAHSPLYEQYLLDELERKTAELTKFMANEKEHDNVENSYNIVGPIDMLLYSAIKYKKEIATSKTDLALMRPFTSGYLFSIWVFVHGDLFFTNANPKRWQEFAVKINQERERIFDRQFCHGGFFRSGEIFQQEFKNTKYAEQIRRLIGDEKEWKSFLACCQYSQKAYAEIEARRTDKR